MVICHRCNKEDAIHEGLFLKNMHIYIYCHKCFLELQNFDNIIEKDGELFFKKAITYETE